MTRQPDPPGQMWCGLCRRYHAVPTCEVCGCELRDLIHRLVNGLRAVQNRS